MLSSASQPNDASSVAFILSWEEFFSGTFQAWQLLFELGTISVASALDGCNLFDLVLLAKTSSIFSCGGALDNRNENHKILLVFHDIFRWIGFLYI